MKKGDLASFFEEEEGCWGNKAVGLVQVDEVLVTN